MDKYPDIDEMIKAAKEKQETGMSMVFGFGVGRMMPLPTDSKKTKKKGLRQLWNTLKS